MTSLSEQVIHSNNKQTTEETKMNVKNIFGTIGDTLTGLFGVLTGLVGVAIMSQVVFGTGWMGMDVVGNISNIVNTFLTGGVTGLLTLIILFSLIDTK